ncbi:MAG: selenium cofactor biosynthesis protein YqeC [Acidimicrobiales bacterium]
MSGIGATSTDSLTTALGLGPTGVTSVVGGGGKTTTIFRLGTELCAAARTVVVTTTTKFGTDQLRGPIVELSTPGDLRATIVSVSGEGYPVIVVERREGTKAFGIPADLVDDLPVHHVLVEADGARRRSLKAPAHYEPVISPGTDLVVAVMGLTALGGVISEVCHRPERVAGVTGASVSDTVDAQTYVTLATSSDGAGRGVPSGARLAVILSQVAEDRRDTAGEIAAGVLGGGGSGPPVERVVLVPHYRPGDDLEPPVEYLTA